MAESIVYEVLRPVPSIGARAGDLILYRPWHHRASVKLVRNFESSDAAALVPWGDLRLVAELPHVEGKPQVLR